jgi:hypothetical protein
LAEKLVEKRVVQKVFHWAVLKERLLDYWMAEKMVV